MKEANKTAFIWTANGVVSAVTFPGEQVSVPGVLTAEVDVAEIVGVGEVWPPVKADKAPKTPKATGAKKPKADAA
ncbi:hypothetical protein [Cupriavidus taiwanensis]|uniref:hypothetical protein n=1 Tax=Cupriavidus taiwanensis TaxID=164546 RepID=UPI000E1017BF|nr:hypothetical protein [Cupriavidus taiwanensis]SPA50616.1 protein of unknown function [Cupriavidus taiwanensis]